jgi:hypothetical protein
MPIHHLIEHQSEVTYETVVSRNYRNLRHHPMGDGQHRCSSSRSVDVPSPILLLHKKRSAHRFADNALVIRNRMRQKSAVL